MESTNRVRGIAHDKNVAKITLIGLPDQPGIAATVFQPLSDNGISVDTIVQNSSSDRITDLTFTVTRADLKNAMEIIQPVAAHIGAKGCISDSKLAKISIVGTGMQNHPGYAAQMFRSLYEEGINIEMITTSEIRITCIVSEESVERGVIALHKSFQLDSID